MKTELCEKAGYNLIHIFEHEWITKQEIVKEKLKAILDINQEKIYAKKCIVKEIETKDKNEFLNEHHLHGEDNSNISLGLFDENELISVMTFAHYKHDQKYTWELTRYTASKHIISGDEKLLSYFRKNHSGTIITYVDRRFNQEDMYKKLGFKLIDKTKPNSFWVKNNKVLAVDNNEIKDETLTNDRYFKLYDCGSLIYTI